MKHIFLFSIIVGFVVIIAISYYGFMPAYLIIERTNIRNADTIMVVDTDFVSHPILHKAIIFADSKFITASDHGDTVYIKMDNWEAHDLLSLLEIEENYRSSLGGDSLPFFLEYDDKYYYASIIFQYTPPVLG